MTRLARHSSGWRAGPLTSSKPATIGILNRNGGRYVAVKNQLSYPSLYVGLVCIGPFRRTCESATCHWTRRLKTMLLDSEPHRQRKAPLDLTRKRFPDVESITKPQHRAGAAHQPNSERPVHHLTLVLETCTLIARLRSPTSCWLTMSLHAVQHVHSRAHSPASDAPLRLPSNLACGVLSHARSQQAVFLQQRSWLTLSRAAANLFKFAFHLAPGPGASLSRQRRQ